MDIAREQYSGTLDGGTPRFGRDADLIKVLNNTNTNLNQFAVLGLDVPLILPADNESEFRRRITFNGVVPTTALHRGKFCILQEPLAINAIGNALVSGATPCNVNTLNSNAALFADVSNNNTALLQSNSSGSARLLWVQNTNNANSNAVVLLGGGAGVSTLTPGNAVNTTIVANTNCNANTLNVTFGTLSATVSINGISFPVNFTLS